MGLTAYGETLPELFENAATGMMSFLAETSSIGRALREKIVVKGSDNESLLVNWLNEILFLLTTQKMIFSQFKVVTLAEGRLEGMLLGEILDPSRHAVQREIKSATYHNLKIEKDAKGHRATVIFDV